MSMGARSHPVLGMLAVAPVGVQLLMGLAKAMASADVLKMRMWGNCGVAHLGRFCRTCKLEFPHLEGTRISKTRYAGASGRRGIREQCQ